MFLFYSSEWKEKLRLVQSSCCGRNAAGCKSRRRAVDAQQTLLCAFLSGPTFKKEKPFQRVFPNGKKKKKKILSEGERFSFDTHCEWSLLRQLISQVFNQPVRLEWRDLLSSQITWLHMAEKPFDEVNLQGSQILFTLTVLSLLDSSPRDHVGLSPERAWKGDSTNPGHTQAHTDTAPAPSLPHQLNSISSQDWRGSAEIIQSSAPSPETLNQNSPQPSCVPESPQFTPGLVRYPAAG